MGLIEIMLTRILHIMNHSSQAISAETLAIQLDKERAVVEAMLQELEAMGRVQKTGVDNTCEACRAKLTCGFTVASSPVYALRNNHR
jgi:predicted transcriptional regulator